MGMFTITRSYRGTSLSPTFHTPVGQHAHRSDSVHPVPASRNFGEASGRTSLLAILTAVAHGRSAAAMMHENSAERSAFALRRRLEDARTECEGIPLPPGD